MQQPAPIGQPIRAVVQAPVPIPDASLTNAGPITTEYNRMKDFTVVRLEKMNLEGSLNLDVSFVYPGKVYSTPEDVIFHFSQSSDTWRYLSYHALSLLLNDTKHLELAKVTHHGSVGSGYVLEQMFAMVSVTQFQQIAASEKVEGQLGSTLFMLKSYQLDTLRALARRIGPMSR